MKPLFAIWGMGTLALAGIIQFAATPAQRAATVASLAPTSLSEPIVLNPITAVATVVDLNPIVNSRTIKTKAQKTYNKKTKTKKVAYKKRKKKSPILASIRKAERFLNRIF